MDEVLNKRLGEVTLAELGDLLLTLAQSPIRTPESKIFDVLSDAQQGRCASHES